MITQTQPAERVAVASGRVRGASFLRTHWLPLLVTALVVLGGLAGPAALTTGATGGDATNVHLHGGWGYVVLAPVTGILDALSLLTLSQHYAVLFSLLVLFVLWRVFRSRSPMGAVRRGLVELGVAVGCLLGLAAFYAYGIVGPRPMAALVPADDDVVVFDVHTHTDHSGDARQGFDVRDRRDWHEAAGFDAVYITDHRTWDGYEAAAPLNPERAGEGIVMLPGIDIKFGGKYACALGEKWRYSAAVDGNQLDRDVMERLYRESGVPPTFVFTLPEDLDSVPAWEGDTMGFVALELSDASPRGLQQSRQDRAQLLRMADSLDLALVAATNNHGWGRTAAAWTLMHLPGWQDLTPRELGAAIEGKLHRERRRASWVVERRVPWAGDDPVALASTVPAMTWAMFGGMRTAERVSWILWAWALALLAARRPWRSDTGVAPAAVRRERSAHPATSSHASRT